LAILVLDAEGHRLAVKYTSLARRQLWTDVKQQLAFEKRVFSKMPKVIPTGSSEVDVAVLDDWNVLFQACNDVIVAVVAASTENELIVMQFVEGIYSAMVSVAPAGFLASGLTKQLVLDKLSDILFVLDEVQDNGIIMETEEDKITARVKMIDETEAMASAEAQEKFQKDLHAKCKPLIEKSFKHTTKTTTAFWAKKRARPSFPISSMRRAPLTRHSGRL